MRYVLRIHKIPKLDQEFSFPVYLESADVNAYSGIGAIGMTRDIGKAVTFSDPNEAQEFWRQQSDVMPFKPHTNEPNRPLTMLICEVVPLTGGVLPPEATI